MNSIFFKCTLVERFYRMLKTIEGKIYPLNLSTSATNFDELYISFFECLEVNLLIIFSTIFFINFNLIVFNTEYVYFKEQKYCIKN